MELSPEILAEVEGLADKLFTRKQICVILRLEYDAVSLLQPFQDAVERARLLRLVKLRDSILSHAEAGSSPAQAMAVKMVEQLRIDEAGV